MSFTLQRDGRIAIQNTSTSQHKDTEIGINIAEMFPKYVFLSRGLNCGASLLAKQIRSPVCRSLLLGSSVVAMVQAAQARLRHDCTPVCGLTLACSFDGLYTSAGLRFRAWGITDPPLSVCSAVWEQTRLSE
jgi:hypothetical protein